ncbi:putative G-protein coupled receptor tkr-1 [Aphelenchoides besseyi]|nr:putative G-protein coupled receptor tkr-1 [Aphelenchoides besseyi]
MIDVWLSLIRWVKKQCQEKKGCLLILFIWIIAGVLSFPNVISARVETKYYYSGVITQRRFCSVDFQYKFLYDNLLFVAQYAIPLLVLTYTYARILLALRNIKFPSAARVNISRNHMRDKQKAIKMLGLVVVIFMVSWFPYQVYHMHPDKFMKNPQVGTYCYLFFYWLAMSACACNPLIYFCFNARFRIGFTYVFRWLPGVRFTEANRQEIFPDCSRNHHTSIRMRQVNTPESPLHPKSPTNFVRSNSPNSPISATSLTLN